MKSFEELVDDFYTLPPKYRTKDKLKEFLFNRIKKEIDYQENQCSVSDVCHPILCAHKDRVYLLERLLKKKI